MTAAPPFPPRVLSAEDAARQIIDDWQKKCGAEGWIDTELADLRDLIVQQLDALQAENARLREERDRLSAGLCAIHQAPDEATTSALKSVAYDIALNCIGEDVARHQIAVRNTLRTPAGDAVEVRAQIVAAMADGGPWADKAEHIIDVALTAAREAGARQMRDSVYRLIHERFGAIEIALCALPLEPAP